MSTAEIIQRLDVIQNEFLVYGPHPACVDGGYRETSNPPDVRIARAVYWLGELRQDLLRKAPDQPVEASDAH